MKIVNTEEKHEEALDFSGLEHVGFAIALPAHPACGGCGSVMAYHMLVRPDGREEEWAECEECGAKSEVD